MRSILDTALRQYNNINNKASCIKVMNNISVSTETTQIVAEAPSDWTSGNKLTLGLLIAQLDHHLV